MPDSPLRVWGGVAHLPSHPAADMHSLVRVVVLARRKHGAVSALKRAGIRQWVALELSQSAVEIAVACETPMVAALGLAYLRPENYSPCQ